ncbi:isoprenyl transferase [Deinococcus aetherius]|uniref:Isoprenyl transferase n=1 Tax=Deinococcus aetherius TaxID=200252 RepID=A0ABM8AHA0_9DEIO|nr:isoprenyl transferase [Deinococcus aetherius]BDP43175.1 isoprenyl transferase [Deinococcus aetherius]
MTRPPVKAALRTAKKTRDAARGALLWGYEQRLARAVRSHGKLPRHLGLILDGNRRYARALGVERELGYEFGIDKAHEVLQWCLELGIPAVTIWVLSTDNVARDPDEVRHLMGLFDREARNLARDPRIHANRVRVRAIGQHHDFPVNVVGALRELEDKTAHYDGMLLNIAVGYGGREEIVDAVKQHLSAQAAAGEALEDVIEHLRPEHISAHLYTAGIPDPDFIIRTSGEIRLSGFMLWQSVYSEYYFCDVYWPGFRRVDFLRALRDFQGRDRRYGK